MYIIVNTNPPACTTDTTVCSPVIPTWNEALCTLAELRSETGNPDLHIYQAAPMLRYLYEDTVVGFDADLWEWCVDPELALFQCKMREAHTVETFTLIDEEEA